MQLKDIDDKSFEELVQKEYEYNTSKQNENLTNEQKILNALEKIHFWVKFWSILTIIGMGLWIIILLSNR
ncbi:MAG: hypothetical protein IJ213_04725 [Bacteroidales bacterium]|nr:hypothetical protein [Bacteroidales bacterium]